MQCRFEVDWIYAWIISRIYISVLFSFRILVVNKIKMCWYDYWIISDCIKTIVLLMLLYAWMISCDLRNSIFISLFLILLMKCDLKIYILEGISISNIILNIFLIIKSLIFFFLNSLYKIEFGRSITKQLEYWFYI